MVEQAAQRVQNLRRSLITLDAVYVAATLALIGLRVLLTPLAPHDFWWHLATGRLIAAEGALPTVDRFSFTQAGQPFYNQSWLAQLVFYGLFQAGGVPLIVVVQSLVLLASYGLLLWLAVWRSGRLRLSVALLLLGTVPLSFDNWNVRPQSYAFALFVGVLIVLTNYRTNAACQRGRPGGFFAGWLWLLPVLLAVWVNLHGSFVLGGVLIGLTLAGEALKRLRGKPALSWPAWRQLLVWGMLSAAALLLNPRGLAVLGYVANLLGSSPVTQIVTEWSPPTVRETSGIIFFGFLIVALLILTYAKRPPDLTDLLLFLAFLWLALGATRNIVWFGLVATPFLAVQAATLLGPPRRGYPGSPTLNGLLIGLLLLLYVLGLPWLKPALWPPSVGALLSPDTPVMAVEALQADRQRPARLLNGLGYGSYLIWEAPEQQVFIDPRIELYPYQQWSDYIALSAGYNVAELLDKYQIDGLLVSKTEQAGLLERVGTLPEWELRYADDEAAYLVRNDSR